MPPEYRFGREIILGAAKFCMVHGLSMLHMGTPVTKSMSDPRQYGVEGVISFTFTAAEIEKYEKWKVAIVTTSSRTPLLNVPSVQADNLLIGRVGAEHLISRGFKSMAFCGIRGHGYSKLRGEGFLQASLEAGIEASWNDEVQIDVSKRPDISSMAQWLKQLKLPVGVMTCNDIRSRHVTEGCRAAGLRTPDHVAIVGVDNDEVICQAMEPMLSSIDPNAYGIGFEAAAMLLRIIEKKNTSQRKLIPPLGVVPRQSTFMVSASDPTLGEALSLIHQHLEDPTSVRNIAGKLGISRRTLERRFREHLGISVATAIRRAHVERAKQLLIDTDLTLEEVADAAGLNDVRQLRISFHRETGQSPSQVRQTFQKISGKS
jgi:LacI family transcriptional regulator